MRFTVRYIPLSKIKPDLSTKMTARIRSLRRMMWDCMNLLVVRKNRKDGSYTILIGNDRYEFLRKHTKNLFAPCLVDESKPKARLRTWFDQVQANLSSSHAPDRKTLRMKPVAWLIIQDFLKADPRFKQLTLSEKLQVSMLAIRYKDTVMASMKTKIDHLSS
ncbi:hypothetical protein [Paenibacillus sp. LHD-38]|uniref:hypothetical protein n=1 Tax=Paenibacillus sp. LHD-38 TaxID=3072143 RepID=UPI00280F36A9|nr:hypothetical protein [Paenibacillus sp. LHD-38]MDQ8737290.1 hypothetical protein [Paenibacillus sp. LHD-38]